MHTGNHRLYWQHVASMVAQRRTLAYKTGEGPFETEQPQENFFAKTFAALSSFTSNAPDILADSCSTSCVNNEKKLSYLTKLSSNSAIATPTIKASSTKRTRGSLIIRGSVEETRETLNITRSMNTAHLDVIPLFEFV